MILASGQGEECPLFQALIDRAVEGKNTDATEEKQSTNEIQVFLTLEESQN